MLPRCCLQGCQTRGVQPMTPTAMSHCGQCGAVVNVHWRSCFVCKADLQPTQREIGRSVGSEITWRGTDGILRGPATVDFLHTDSDGSIWAFVTLSDGSWAAVNTKFLRQIQRAS